MKIGGDVGPDEDLTASCLPYPTYLAPSIGTLNSNTEIPLAVVLVEFDSINGVAADGKIDSRDDIWQEKIFIRLNNYFTEVLARQHSLRFVPVKENKGLANDGIIRLSANDISIGKREDFDASEDPTVLQSIGKTLANYISAADMDAYDTDDNNIIDAFEMQILLVIRGYEAAVVPGREALSVFAHHSGLGSDYKAIIHGKEIMRYSIDGSGNGYTMIGELHGHAFPDRNSTDYYTASIGVVAHEMMHAVFGLPDLYDIDNDSTGIGAYGLMGTGTWGYIPTTTGGIIAPALSLYGPGSTPVHLSAWSKVQLGAALYKPAPYLTPSYTLTAAAVTQNATDQANIIRLATPNAKEYFLVEARNFSGYDEGMKGLLSKSPTDDTGGVLIWHIDDNRVCYLNRDNADQTHKRVDLEEANGLNILDTGTSSGLPTDMFTAVAGQNEFNRKTNPNSLTYDRKDSSVTVHVTAIDSANGTANVSVHTNY